MNLGVKLQELRKLKGISQQELADLLNVSRQSVSKWELNDSVPEIGKIVLISEIYSVSIDHLLKETDETVLTSERKNNDSKILFIVATFLIVLGLLCAIGGWDQDKYLESIAGGLILQMIGLAVLFIGKTINPSEVFPIKLKIANYMLLTFMPVSIVTNKLKTNPICPYPRNTEAVVLFLISYGVVVIIGLLVIRKFKKSNI